VKSACYGDPKKYAVGFYEQIFLFYLKKWNLKTKLVARWSEKFQTCQRSVRIWWLKLVPICLFETFFVPSVPLKRWCG
jgi:hypothetical protein